jgi:hypothetical protein
VPVADQLSTADNSQAVSVRAVVAGQEKKLRRSRGEKN